MVAHAVYMDVSLPAVTATEGAAGSIVADVAVAGHVARRTGSEGAAGSAG